MVKRGMGDVDGDPAFFDVRLGPPLPNLRAWKKRKI